MSPLSSPLRAVAWLLAAAALSHMLAQLLQGKPLAALLASALAVDWVLTRAGAGWYSTSTLRGGPGWRQATALGAAAGGAAALAAALAGLASGQASLRAWGLDVLGLVSGLLGATVQALRAELLLRWGPIRLLGPSLPAWATALVAVLCGVAPVLGEHGLRWPSLAVAASLGALTTALALRTSNFLAPLAAAAAARLLAAPMALGVEVQWTRGALLPLEAASGPGAWWLAGSLALAAAVVARGAKR